jgi:hypothetical protein
VIVAVVAVGVMQVPVDQVVDVVAMRHRLVTAVRAVDVVGVVALTLVVGCALRRIVVVDVEAVLVDVVLVWVVQVAIV